MAEKFDSASQKVTPRDAQKGGQGALSKEHPEIALRQDEPQAADIQSQQASEGLTTGQIALLCELEERDVSKLTQDKRQDVERLLSKGYIEPLDASRSMGPRFRLTEKGADLLSKRGVGLNEA